MKDTPYYGLNLCEYLIRNNKDIDKIQTDTTKD